MRINKLYIKGFKNIHEQNFDLSAHNGLTLLIGNNGSGKSNFIECISDIFYNLYEDKTLFSSDFIIEYSDNSNKIFKVEYINGKIKKSGNGVEISMMNQFVLPKRIVTIYSGETDRLWRNCYEDSYKKFVSKINKAANPANIISSPTFPQMLFLNKFYWDIALLSLMCSNSQDIIKFCDENLGTIEIEKIEFRFCEKSKYDSYSISDILNFIKRIDNKLVYTKDEFVSIMEETEIDSAILFKFLYLAFTSKDSKLIENIEVSFTGGGTVDSLSEGVKKRLLIKAALEFAGQEDTLFLLDEPDAHVHLGNKKEIIETINLYTNNRHVILTSHSPTLCKYVPKESIILMNNGSPNSVSSQIDAGRQLADDDEIFDILFSTKHLIITEGKTDCTYIKKALFFYKDQYPILDNHTEFISIGGTDGEVVKDFLSKIVHIGNRKIILLVDRDDAGLKCAKAVLGNNNLTKKNIDNAPIPNSIGQYILMLPNLKGDQNDFVIEDYFDKLKIKELTKNHIDTNFSDKNFKQFPKVKDDLKNQLLPSFCSNDATKPDMRGFIILLNKLNSMLS
ncbi:MAG: AAA family ATPase [Bacteroidaceae bacterium]